MLLEANDRVIRRRLPIRRILISVASVAVILFGLSWALGQVSGGTATLSEGDVSIGTARIESFTPAVTTEGMVVSATSTVVSVGEAGLVETVFVENGDVVARGQPVMQLRNPALVREVADIKAGLLAQLGDLVAAENRAYDQMRDAEGALRDAEYKRQQARAVADRQRVLAEGGFAAASALERAVADLAYAEELVRAASIELSATRRASQDQLVRLGDIRKAVEAMIRAQDRRLADLTVVAPASGKLTGFEPVLGQAHPAGAPIGRIEDEGTLEITAEVPEVHVRRLSLGGTGSFQAEGKTVPVRVRAIEPTVSRGHVRVRLRIVGATPSALTLGQSLRVNIDLGRGRQSLTIPTGPAVEPSRLFVVQGSTARARDVRFGDRSGERLEVLSGLEPGDRVIVAAAIETRSLRQIQLRDE